MLGERKDPYRFGIPKEWEITRQPRRPQTIRVVHVDRGARLLKDPHPVQIRSNETTESDHDPVRRRLMILGTVGLGAVIFTSLCGEKYADQRTSAQKEAEFYFNEGNVSVFSDIIVSGEDGWPAHLRRKPGAEDAGGGIDKFTGVKIRDLKPGYKIPRGFVVWGASTSSMGRRGEPERWLAVELENGQTGFLSFVGVETKPEFYTVDPVRLETFKLPLDK